MKKLAIAVSLLLSTQVMTAEPFGIKAGDKPSKYGELKNYALKNITPPKPNAGFDIYTAFATEKTGVCKVLAYGKAFDTSVFGEEVVRKYKSITGIMDAKYTLDKEYDFVRQGSLWTEPKYYMMGLYKNERSLISFYQDKTDDTKIIVEAAALSTESAFIKITYEFSNFDECSAEFEAARGDSF